MKNENGKILKIRLKKKPSNLLNTLRVFLPHHKGFTFGQKLPVIELTRKRFTINRKHFENFKRIVGEGPGDQGLKFLYPMTLAYPMEIKILSHKIMPISIFRVVNIRKHVILHRPFKLSGAFDMRCVLDQQRFVPNGMELDFNIRLHQKDCILWECRVKGYYLKALNVQLRIRFNLA